MMLVEVQSPRQTASPSPGERAELCSGARARGQRSQGRGWAGRNPELREGGPWASAVASGEKCRAT